MIARSLRCPKIPDQLSWCSAHCRHRTIPGERFVALYFSSLKNGRAFPARFRHTGGARTCLITVQSSIVNKAATRRLAENRGAALCQLLAEADEADGTTLGSSKTAPRITVEHPSKRRFIMLQASEI